MDDLFDVFEEQVEENEARQVLDMEEHKASMPVKRMTEEALDLTLANKIQKKPKLDTQKTIIADEFTTSVVKDFTLHSKHLDQEYSNDKKEAEKEIEPQTSDPQHIQVMHNVNHRVVLPQDCKDHIPISQHKRPEHPARMYPFKLDPFQETAISAIERNESVLVSAHTSAGKTVVAEYAIATSLRDKQRVIYTSPIKALSNQKYRELLEEFGDVGLMTGDVTINGNASCLVMTTEILLSMLYRGSEIVREVAWIVFDEIHYMRDKSRGVVWEETIILCPANIRFVFLSATIPNSLQFVEWIVSLKQFPCHVVYTDYRPTPLQHYLFPAGGDGIHLCVDEKSNFREDNFQRAIGSLHDTSNESSGKKKKKSKQKGNSDLYKIIKMIMMKNYSPVIVFSFSKRDCENNALQISKLDFNTDDEKEMVSSIFNNAIQSLSEEDRVLPQIEHVLPLLRRGIGIHHSGLLPILKEVIEILFQESLLKILFATETFSIGLNMPAKTVVFTSVRKWDGKEHRWLGSGEYIQMSGRAGRRGLDERGIVILMIDEKMEPAIAKGMLKGEADRLDSAFHLEYSMILNLIRVEMITPEDMLAKSFYQFQTRAKIPQLEQDLDILRKRLDHIQIENDESIKRYYDIRLQLAQCERDFRDVITVPRLCIQFLQPGRLLKIKVTRKKRAQTPDEEDKVEELEFGWGVLINYQNTLKVKGTDPFQNAAEGTVYMLDVALFCELGTETYGRSPRPPVGEQGELLIIPVLLSSVECFSSVKVFLPKDLKSREGRGQIEKIIKEVKRRFNDQVPLLDPVEDMGIKDESFLKLIKKIEILEKKLTETDIYTAPNLEEQYNAYSQKLAIASQIRSINKRINRTQSIIQLDELKSRRRVLRRLGYVSDQGVINLKGRVACEISTGDEILLTEMMFQGVFNDLSVQVCVGLLSCFVWKETSDEGSSNLRQELLAPFKVLKEHAKKVVKVYQECKLDIEEDVYIDSFRPELMEISFMWAQGATFAQICKLSNFFEGSIIRAIRNLEELLRQMNAAAKVIGNDALEAKFAEATTRIKRDIVFAASLYL